MELLLDTHVLLWWLADDGRLPANARSAIADPEHRVLVSAASIWEISIKRAIGRLRSPTNLLAVLDECGFEVMPITAAHAELAGALPRHHDDPFDRMLVAQATIEGLTIVTFDERMTAYRVSRLGP